MTAPPPVVNAPAGLPRLRLRPLYIVRLATVAVLALGLLYLVWGLYLSGEPLFAVVAMALAIGIVIVFGSSRFYAARFVFPGVAAVLIFIALPVIYTSYVGFTNFGAKNLLTQDRVTAYHLAQKTIDKSTERPFSIVATDGGGYRIFFPEGGGGFLTDTMPLDGVPATVSAQAVTSPPTAILEMKDVIKLRSALQQVTATLPDGSQVTSSGLRTFAKVRPVYTLQPDGTLLSPADGSRLTPDSNIGFYRDDAGEQVAPGWRVWVGAANFTHILTSVGIREPMLQIFLWTVAFATLSMILTFSLGILLGRICVADPFTASC